MASAAVGLTLASCAATDIGVFAPGMPAPATVVVSDFEFSPDVVLLDRGFAAQLQRSTAKLTPAQVREQLAARVSEEIVAAMAATLGEAGLAAREGGEETILLSEPTLFVTGRVRTIDPGNRTRRNVVGFGAGKSGVTADVAVTHFSGSGRREILKFAVEAESAGRPGPARGAATAVVTRGDGAAVVRLSADVAAEARRIGQAAARRIIAYATEQGWIRTP